MSRAKGVGRRGIRVTGGIPRSAIGGIQRKSRGYVGDVDVKATLQNFVLPTCQRTSNGKSSITPMLLILLRARCFLNYSHSSIMVWGSEGNSNGEGRRSSPGNG